MAFIHIKSLTMSVSKAVLQKKFCLTDACVQVIESEVQNIRKASFFLTDLEYMDSYAVIVMSLLIS